LVVKNVVVVVVVVRVREKGVVALREGSSFSFLSLMYNVVVVVGFVRGVT